MRCEVKSNYVVSNKEGKAKEYSGYADSFEVGDNLYFKFEIPSYDAKGTFFKLSDVNDSTEAWSYFNGDGTLTAKANGFFWKTASSNGHSISFKTDFINLDFILGNLVLTRYYKSDWNGYLVNHNPLSVSAQIATLDCRQSSDKVDEFIDYVKRLSK